MKIPLKTNTIVIILAAIIYFFSKIFFLNQGNLITDLLTSVILLITFFRFKSIFISIALLSILSYSAVFNFLITGIFFAFYLIHIFQNKKGIPRIEFYGLFFLFIISLQTFFIGGNHTYGFVKTLCLFALPSYYLMFSKNIYSYKINSTSITIIYIVVSVTQIIYAFYINPDSRGSIFYSSENIALIIITMLYMLTLTNTKSIYLKIINFLLFTLFVFSTESKSAFIIIFLILPLFIFRKKTSTLKTIIKLTIYIPIIIFIIVTFISEIKEMGIYNRSKQIIDLLSFLSPNTINEFYEADLRGQIYNEGFSLWAKNPLFGNGAIPSKVLSRLNGFPVYNFHSSLIDTLVQYGILGLVSIIGMFFFLIHSIRKKIKSLFILYYILIFIMSSLVQPYLFNIKVVSIFFFTLPILVLQKRVGKSEKD